MSEIELRARNLLASCLNEWGHYQEAGNVRDGDDLESYEFELRVIGQLLRFGFDTGHGHATRAPQWQPIAEAPQDGTRLMLWDSESKRPVFGSWRPDSAHDHGPITHFAAEPAGPEVG